MYPARCISAALNTAGLPLIVTKDLQAATTLRSTDILPAHRRNNIEYTLNLPAWRYQQPPKMPANCTSSHSTTTDKFPVRSMLHRTSHSHCTEWHLLNSADMPLTTAATAELSCTNEPGLLLSPSMIDGQPGLHACAYPSSKPTSHSCP